VFYARLEKLLGVSPHPRVSYLFQNQTPGSPADEALWNVALGSTALGGTAAGVGVLSNPPPALGGLVLKVDSMFQKCVNLQCGCMDFEVPLSA
jgi:hypothetical protein